MRFRIRPRLAAFWLPCLVSLGVIAAGSAGHAAEDPLVGRAIAGFTLPDFHGQSRSLADWDDSKLVVVAFLGNECPLARTYTPRLMKLADTYGPQGVAFVAINANVQDTLTEIADFVHAIKLDFPLLKDATGEVTDLFGAQRTPEVFVLDRERVVRYHGRVDDQFGVGVHRAKVQRADLAAALDDLLAGREVQVAATETPGCYIGRARRTPPTGSITYTKHVAAIFNRHCVECHRNEELAPFSLASYADLEAWTPTIGEVLRDGRMPPWFADPQYGVWANDCSLSAADKQLVLEWIDNGAPEGDPADLPPAPKFTTGWRIGHPDGTYSMKAPYTVPAEGVLDYQHFTVDPQFTEDKWIVAAEARPGNPAVVHHIVLFVVPRSAPDLEGSSDLSQIGGGGAGAQLLAIYAPGMPPWQYPAGGAMKVPKDSKFVLQMHYTTNGTEQTDLSSVGLKFADPKEVKQVVRNGMSINFGFEIPPGAANYKVTATSKFRKDTLVLQLFPHMHYRGKSFRIEAFYPDGAHEVLLDVPKYDFNWQLRYDLAQPKLMPKGTKMVSTAYYDNSADNPRNPDPTETVRFGLQSFEEMMVGYYTFIRPDEQPHAEEEVAATSPAGGD
ncbi:MAG: redoxin domain-containing protein [Pirellulales bacterium]|nr:redoxin domain-containing protein [Pirellulales bacterium]